MKDYDLAVIVTTLVNGAIFWIGQYVWFTPLVMIGTYFLLILIRR